MRDATQIRNLSRLLAEELISKYLRIIEDERNLSDILGTFFGVHKISDDKEREKIIKFSLPDIHPDKISSIEDAEKKTALTRIVIEYYNNFENQKIPTRSAKTTTSNTQTNLATQTSLTTNAPAHPETYTPEGWRNYQNSIIVFLTKFFQDLGISYTPEEIQQKAEALKTVWQYYLMDIRIITHVNHPPLMRWLPCVTHPQFILLLNNYDKTDIEIAVIAHLLRALYKKNNIKEDPNNQQIRQSLDSRIVESILNDLTNIMPTLSQKIRDGSISLSKIFDESQWADIVRLNDNSQIPNQYCNPTAFYPPQDFEHLLKEETIVGTIYRERLGKTCDWLLFPMNLNPVDSILDQSYLNARYGKPETFGAISDERFHVLPNNVVRVRKGYYTLDKILLVFGEENQPRYGIIFKDFASEEKLNQYFANLSKLIQYYQSNNQKIFLCLQYTRSSMNGSDIGYYLSYKNIKQYNRIYSTHHNIKIDQTDYSANANGIQKFFQDTQVNERALKNLPYPDRTKELRLELPEESTTLSHPNSLPQKPSHVLDLSSLLTNSSENINQNPKKTSAELSPEQLSQALLLAIFFSPNPAFYHQLQNPESKESNASSPKISPYLNLTTFSNPNNPNSNIEEKTNEQSTQNTQNNFKETPEDSNNTNLNPDNQNYNVS